MKIGTLLVLGGAAVAAAWWWRRRQSPVTSAPLTDLGASSARGTGGTVRDHRGAA